MLKKGEIVWVDLGEVTEVAGHEQALRRPCIILKDFNRFHLTIVIPLTTSPNSYYTIVRIDKTDTGMNRDSYALCHQLRTISHHRIDGKAGILTDRAFNKIKGVLIDVMEL
ncbi:MAG: type II toxin-antitoxin system PemK/MazF family toxin [Bacteroidota bacterium]